MLIMHIRENKNVKYREGGRKKTEGLHYMGYRRLSTLLSMAFITHTISQEWSY